MYYHPMAYTGGAGHDGIARFEQLIDLLAESVEEQQRIRMEVVREICLGPMRYLGALADAKDGTEFVARCFAVPSPSYARLVELSLRAGELAARTSLQFHDLLRRHSRGGTAWPAAPASSDEHAKPDSPPSARTRATPTRPDACPPRSRGRKPDEERSCVASWSP